MYCRLVNLTPYSPDEGISPVGGNNESKAALAAIDPSPAPIAAPSGPPSSPPSAPPAKAPAVLTAVPAIA
jgi:hypothetical protein